MWESSFFICIIRIINAVIPTILLDRDKHNIGQNTVYDLQASIRSASDSNSRLTCKCGCDGLIR